MTIMFLDLETTGQNPRTALPIQVGLAIKDGDGEIHTFKTLFKWNKFRLAENWNDEAANTHKIPFESLILDPNHPRENFHAYRHMKRFVEAHTHEMKFKNNAVGWNVGTFDMPFMEEYFPHIFNRFSYVSYDMNSVLLGAGRRWDKNVLKAQALIDLVKDDMIGEDDQEHDALVDSLICLKICEKLGVI